MNNEQIGKTIQAIIDKQPGDGSYFPDLDVLQMEIGKWSDYNFPENKPYQPLLGCQEELGELAHAHLKHEQGIRKGIDLSITIALKEDAVADIFIYLLDYCNRSGIVFSEIIKKTWNEVSQRDWQKCPKNGRTE